MARPKTIKDEFIIEAAYELIMDEGPQSLTFERLGKKVGLVPAALVRRFTTKQRLIAEVDQFALNRSTESFKKIVDGQDAPIEAILAGFVAELSFATTLERFIHGQEFLLMDLAAPDLYTNYQASFKHRYQQVAQMLEAAKSRGELSDDLEPKEVARLLQMILHGAGHVWAMSQEGPIEDYIDTYIRMALEPYRTKEGK